MWESFPPLPLEGIKTVPLASRPSKVRAEQVGRPHAPGRSFREFLRSLPDILAAGSFREAVSAVAGAAREGKVVALGMGGHPIKVGLSPILIDLMKRGVIRALAMNGSGIVHDFEMAFAGRTSEDVDASIDAGEFGMAEETGRILNEAIAEGARAGLGIGEAVGQRIVQDGLPHAEMSLLAAGVRLGVPVTVHVALGTDILHVHPQANGAAIGEGSFIDFRTFASVVSRLEGGVYINLGSAVILPEVFLKALTLARSQGHRVDKFVTVNMDFIQHYRPLNNVVRRPTQKAGRGIALTGHHEILFPLFAAAVIEELGESVNR
ncbi:MAG: hypothetical protein A2V83_08920 [Nitrospirae bacterium RBG_16_64_22]|nr:MAG: hypothetical protein A2V83_08920 [Nitrospirae bacterium RBG_16_64_22]